MMGTEGTHPMGEATRKALGRQHEAAIALDTFGGRIHVEWDPAAAITPLGQLPFFIEFLKVLELRKEDTQAERWR